MHPLRLVVRRGACILARMGRISGFFLCCLLVASTSTAEHIPVDLSANVPGNIFCTPEEAKEIRLRVERYPWAQTIHRSLVRRAERLLTRPLELPRRSGGWHGEYHCSKDNKVLRPHEDGGHICPQCNTVYTGRDYDIAYITTQHEYWIDGVETLGWAYTTTEDERFAARAREILCAYADLGEAKITGKTDREFLVPQTLDEARLLCKLLVGYDRVYNFGDFTENDRQRIAKFIIKPILDRIGQGERGLSNWQVWHNAAIACAGLLLSDEEMVDSAINGESGFMMHMEAGVLDSGMWHERAPLYHFFALQGYIYLLEGMARSGYDFYLRPEVIGMFDAPLRWLYPDDTLPPINDSDRVDIRKYRRLYEIIYRRTQHLAYEHVLEPRDSIWALVWGARGLPANFEQRVLLRDSSNDASEGVAILRDKKRGIAAYLNYGDTSAPHSHRAVLGLSVFAFDDERVVDPGRIAYGNALYKKWYRQTLAHNAPLIDQTGQRADAGSLLNFYADDNVAMVRATATAGREDVAMTRTLFLSDGLLLDIFQFRAEDEHLLDLPLHINGVLLSDTAASHSEALGEEAGYPLLEQVRTFVTPPKNLGFDAGNDRTMRMRFLRGAEETYLADAIGRIPTERLPMLLQRSRTQETTIATVTEFLAPDEKPRKILYRDQGPIVVEFGEVSMRIDDEVFITSGGERYRIDRDKAVHVDQKGEPVVLTPREQMREALRQRNEARLPGQRRPSPR